MDMNILISATFLLLGIIMLIKVYLSKTYYNLFWFCDVVPFLLAISFFTDNIQFTKGLINIGLLTQLITLSLLLYGFISRKNTIGSEATLSRGPFYVIVEILVHLPILLALILTYNTLPTSESLIYSAIIIIILFFVTLLFADPKHNINMLYKLSISEGKDEKILKLPYQTQLWVIYTFVVAMITFLIQQFLYL